MLRMQDIEAGSYSYHRLHEKMALVSLLNKAMKEQQQQQQQQQQQPQHVRQQKSNTFRRSSNCSPGSFLLLVFFNGY
jgi:hypothetical protein